MAAELARRRDCRYGLKGVPVEWEGTPYTVRSTDWGKDCLHVTLDNGRRVDSREVILAGKWPVVCCRPARRERQVEDVTPTNAA